MHLKVKGFSFSQNITAYDPVMKKVVDKPMKPFMVNQLSISFERHRIMMSPFDEVLHKQLVDYTVERIGKNGPVFSSINEHFVDALGLAHLAFVLEFTDLVGTIKNIENSSKVSIVNNTVQASSINKLFESIKNPYTSRSSKQRNDDDDLPGDKPPNYTVYKGTGVNVNRKSYNNNWGTRNVLKSHGNATRRMW